MGAKSSKEDSVDTESVHLSVCETMSPSLITKTKETLRNSLVRLRWMDSRRNNQNTPSNMLDSKSLSSEFCHPSATMELKYIQNNNTNMSGFAQQMDPRAPDVERTPLSAKYGMHRPSPSKCISEHIIHSLPLTLASPIESRCYYPDSNNSRLSFSNSSL